MNKFVLTADEEIAFKAISQTLCALPEASQYNVLRNVAHMMDREVCRIGSIRAAAAVAGSTARVLAEGKSLKGGPLDRPSRVKHPYPTSFTEGVGKPLLAAQRAAREKLSDPPTEAQRAALRAASQTVRDGFRRFKEADVSKKL